ncbi:CBU_0592 family membrane protein [Candidatus Coxiella mudrowiae]|uniref:Membrane spanning protein n=2 Tax=Candidatus Coxiella mudrowiae TaxID=2054173 RepID=A0ABM5UUI1_9COXI|nr:putative membrane spanning protein [Candidatus Coxiella mudrowiae]
MGYLIRFLSEEFNIIGISGVLLVLLAYCLLQMNKLNQSSITYSLLNFIGSGFILISLYFSWNLASGIIEIAWLLISLFGLTKAIYFRREIRLTNLNSG